MRRLLQGIAAGVFGVTLAALIPFWIVKGTEPAGHMVLWILYGALATSALIWFLARFVWFSLGSPPARAGESVDPKRLARRVIVELATIDGTLSTAVDDGRWWDVMVTGLPSEWWNRAADALPARVHDAVAPAYVEADLLNKAANGHFSAGYRGGGRKRLSADEAARLEDLRQAVGKASAALDRYVR
jgi:hypothetical protein